MIPYLRIENLKKTIPYRAAHTYIAHIWEYPPPGGGHFILVLTSADFEAMPISGKKYRVVSFYFNFLVIILLPGSKFHETSVYKM